LSRKLRSFRDLDGCFNFRSAFASICRMRSLVTENCSPTSSGVWSVFMPIPKRLRSTRSSNRTGLQPQSPEKREFSTGQPAAIGASAQRKPKTGGTRQDLGIRNPQQKNLTPVLRRPVETASEEARAKVQAIAQANQRHQKAGCTKKSNLLQNVEFAG
jgi:hypothetical protein